MHLYLQAEIDEVDYITTGVESSPIITAIVESALHRVCAAASSGKCVVARTWPWLEPGSPEDAVNRFLSI